MSTPLTVSEFRRLIDRAAAVRDSFASCRATIDEIERESAAVARVVAELKTATLCRPSVALELELASMLVSIGHTAAFRLAQVRQIRAGS